MSTAIEAALVSALVGPLLKILSDLTLKELKNLRKASHSLKALETTIFKAEKLFKKVKPFLLQGKFQSVVQDRIDTLTIRCYEAEDLIEDIRLMIIKKSKRAWVKKFGISKLQEKLDDIMEQLKGLVDVSPSENEVKHGWGDRTIDLVGRDDDIKAIIEELTLSPNTNNGVCIVGMNGVGKTALALRIIEDARISQEFHIVKVEVPTGRFNCEESINELKKGTAKESFPGEKTTLIMFDNLLDVGHMEWGNFWSQVKGLKKNKNTKILITTLNPRVSNISLTTEHKLKPLSEIDSQQVIKEYALSYNSNLQISQFTLTMVETLAKQCEGLPGVACYLGGLLATWNINQWDTAFNLWDLPDFKKFIVPLLSLSYANMQLHLLRCLAYFALFPHGYGYSVDTLIQLWAGEGFIHQVEGNSIAEQADEFSLNDDFVQRSILQPSDDGVHTKKSIYKLHKFNHNFSKLAASTICLQLHKPGYINNARHLSILCDIDEPLCKKLAEGKGLRTLLSLCNPKIDVKVRIPPNLFKALKYLRVLALSRTNLDNIPDSIDKLEHLRFLDISYTLIETLPIELCELHNLQFLKIKDTKLRQLPKAFDKLTSLRCVDWEIADIRRMKSLPENIGALSQLETLPLFRVSSSVEYYSIEQLKNMNSLQGSISITNLENVKSKTEAEGAKLYDKPNLKTIELEWTKISSVSQENSLVSKEVLTGLKPHNNLRELKITNYNNRLFPEWMSNSTRILENIHLYNCPSCSVLPPLGELQHLKTLILEEFLILKSVDGLFLAHTPFKSLESLTFKSLTEIQECIALESNVLPSLRNLEIIDCAKLTNLSTLEHLTSLEDLHIEGCTTLKSLPELPVSLKKLIIRNCDLLKDRCQNGGEDWQKVDHILEVEIDDEEVTTSASLRDVLAPRDQQIDGNGGAISVASTRDVPAPSFFTVLF